MGRVQFRLADGQRAVRDRRADQSAVGFARNCLQLAGDRLWRWRLGVGTSKPPIAHRGTNDGRLRGRQPRLALGPDAPPRGRVHADRCHAHRSGDGDGPAHAARHGNRRRGIRDAVPPLFRGDHRDPRRVWRVDGTGESANRCQSPHTVDRRLGTHQYRGLLALGHGTGQSRSCDQDPGDASGRVTNAMAPPPSRGFSATVPPCRDSRRRTMARPRPVPLVFVV